MSNAFETERAPGPIRVLLVDDHPIFRAGIRCVLEAEGDLRVVGEAGSGEEGTELARELRPEVVAMDIAMPGCGGVEATHRIRRHADAPTVVMLTMRPEAGYAVASADAGALGYLTKQCTGAALREALRAAGRGEPCFSPSAMRLLASHRRDQLSRTPMPDPLRLLSSREREVLVRVAEGYTALEIGEQLQISGKTVDTYRHRVMSKLGLSHRSELVRLTLRYGLLTASTS